MVEKVEKGVEKKVVEEGRWKSLVRRMWWKGSGGRGGSGGEVEVEAGVE